jgi:hypothetical protein
LRAKEDQASLERRGNIRQLSRGLKPTAKLKPSLRDEESAYFAQKFG